MREGIHADRHVVGDLYPVCDTTYKIPTPYRPIEIAILITVQITDLITVDISAPFHRPISLPYGDHVANEVRPCRRGVSLP